MEKNTHITGAHKTILGLSLAGVAFAGYLTVSKLLTGVCAFGEQCPNFLGYPTCWYGLGMFVALSVASALLVAGKFAIGCAMRAISLVSLLGILFAGYYTVGELGTVFTDGFAAYALGLPTCAYGLVVYIIIAALSLPRAIASFFGDRVADSTSAR